MSEHKTIGLSGVDLSRSDAITSLSHHSPATHGMLRVALEIQDSTITSAQPLLGSMHRGAEKLFESRDYRQVLGLANRHEWLSAYSGEVGVAQLVEQALGMEVPQSAKVYRLMMLEVSRITSHLAFLAGFPWPLSDSVQAAREQREKLVAHIRMYTGSRMHHMLTRIGGLTHAPSNEWLIELFLILREVSTYVSELNLTDIESFSGIGVLSNSLAIQHSLSGPVARASGYRIDLRNNDEILAGIPQWSTCVEHNGDVAARLTVLMREIQTSALCVLALEDVLLAATSDEVNVLLPKVLRVPEGQYEHSIETPLGIASWYLVSRGDKMPYRLKLRPASLNTVLAIPDVLIGQHIDNVDSIIASMPFVAGDVDR